MDLREAKRGIPNAYRQASEYLRRSTYLRILCDHALLSRRISAVRDLSIISWLGMVERGKRKAKKDME